MSGLALSYQQLKAILNHMPPPPLRYQIWNAWKEEKKTLEGANQNDYPACKSESATGAIVHIHRH